MNPATLRGSRCEAWWKNATFRRKPRSSPPAAEHREAISEPREPRRAAPKSHQPRPTPRSTLRRAPTTVPGGLGTLPPPGGPSSDPQPRRRPRRITPELVVCGSRWKKTTQALQLRRAEEQRRHLAIGLLGAPVQDAHSELGAPKSPEVSGRTCGGAHWPISEPLFPGVSFPYDDTERGQRLVSGLPHPTMLRLQVFSTS